MDSQSDSYMPQGAFYQQQLQTGYTSNPRTGSFGNPLESYPPYNYNYNYSTTPTLPSPLTTTQGGYSMGPPTYDYQHQQMPNEAQTLYCKGPKGTSEPHLPINTDVQFLNQFGCCFDCIRTLNAGEAGVEAICRGVDGTSEAHRADSQSFQKFQLCFECIPTVPLPTNSSKPGEKRKTAKYEADQMLLQNFNKCIDDILTTKEKKHVFELLTDEEKNSGELMYEKIKHVSMAKTSENWSKKNREANSFCNMMYTAYNTPTVTYSFNNKTRKVMKYGNVRKSIIDEHEGDTTDSTTGKSSNSFLIAETFIVKALKEHERSTPLPSDTQSLLAAQVINASKGIKKKKQPVTETFKVDEKFNDKWSKKLEMIDLGEETSEEEREESDEHHAAVSENESEEGNPEMHDEIVEEVSNVIEERLNKIDDSEISAMQDKIKVTKSLKNVLNTSDGDPIGHVEQHVKLTDDKDSSKMSDSKKVTKSLENILNASDDDPIDHFKFSQRNVDQHIKLTGDKDSSKMLNSKKEETETQPKKRLKLATKESIVEINDSKRNSAERKVSNQVLPSKFRATESKLTDLSLDDGKKVRHGGLGANKNVTLVTKNVALVKERKTKVEANDKMLLSAISERKIKNPVKSKTSNSEKETSAKKRDNNKGTSANVKDCVKATSAKMKKSGKVTSYKLMDTEKGSGVKKTNNEKMNGGNHAKLDNGQQRSSGKGKSTKTGRGGKLI